jgi:coatomer protein complex subunit alpha (xenin)
VLILCKKDVFKSTQVEQKKIDNTKSACFVSKEKICVLTNKGGLYIYTYDGKSK